jgi:hypothetical protein
MVISQNCLLRRYISPFIICPCLFYRFVLFWGAKLSRAFICRQMEVANHWFFSADGNIARCSGILDAAAATARINLPPAKSMCWTVAERAITAVWLVRLMAASASTHHFVARGAGVRGFCDAANCVAPVVGITHQFRNLKNTQSMSLSFCLRR